jgi:hypothetical protein
MTTKMSSIAEKTPEAATEGTRMCSNPKHRPSASFWCIAVIARSRRRRGNLSNLKPYNVEPRTLNLEHPTQNEELT